VFDNFGWVCLCDERGRCLTTLVCLCEMCVYVFERREERERCLTTLVGCVCVRREEGV